MMRRGRIFRCPAAFRMKALQPEPEMSYAQKKRALEESERKARAGRTLRPISNPAADHNDAQVALDRSQMGKNASMFDGEFAGTKEELRQWMNVKQAALLLQIPEKKLYGLRTEEVNDAWRGEYPLAKTHRHREELNAAAELLLEYVSSDLAREQTLDHYADHLIQAKKDIHQELDKDKQSARNRAYDVLGAGHLLITFLFTGSIVLMFRYLDSHDADLAVKSAKRQFKNAMLMPQNDEPSPDYQTRYRDTPTSIDEHMAQPHPDITEPKQRELILRQEEDNEREEELLARLSDDVATEAEIRQREAEKDRRRALMESNKNLSKLDLLDGVVRTVPPPGVRQLRRDEELGRL